MGVGAVAGFLRIKPPASPPLCARASRPANRLRSTSERSLIIPDLAAATGERGFA